MWTWQLALLIDLNTRKGWCFSYWGYCWVTQTVTQASDRASSENGERIDNQGLSLVLITFCSEVTVEPTPLGTLTPGWPVFSPSRFSQGTHCGCVL